MADEKGKYAYNYLVSKGLSPMAAAGIIGNLHAESGLNTRIPGRADNKGSIGIAQWHSERKQGLYDFAKRKGTNAYDLTTQLDYLVDELKSPAYKKAFVGISNAKTPDEAAVAFMNDFEKPAEWAKRQSIGQRVGMARSIFSGTPYQNVNYQEEGEYGVDTSLNLPMNTGDYQTAPDIPSKEDLEAEQAKAELLQKQKEKDFLAEVQNQQEQDTERRQQQDELYQQQQQQDTGIDPAYYQMPQIALPEYIAPQQMQQQEQFKDGGKLSQFKKKPFQLQDERNQIQRDATNVFTQRAKTLQQLNVKNKTDKEIAQERKAKIQASVKAQKTPYTKENWRQQLAAETQATGDKLRVSNYPNFFDDYINPAAMIGAMASNLGQAPLQAEQSDSVMPYVTAIGAPLVTGALAGIGAKTTSQFANNIINPLAGTGDLVDLYRVQKAGQVPGMSQKVHIENKIKNGEPLTFLDKGYLKKFEDSPYLKGTHEGAGRWFTSDPSALEYYKKDLEGSPLEILKYSLPKKEAQRFNVSNFDNIAAASADLKTEYTLPDELIKKAERLDIKDLPKYVKKIQKPNSFQSEINWENWNNEMKKYEDGGDTSNFDNNSARDWWIKKTGKSWEEAKKLGYSDGTSNSNIKLLNQLKDKNFTLNKENTKVVQRTIPRSDMKQFKGFSQEEQNSMQNTQPPVTRKSVALPVAKAKRDIKQVDKIAAFEKVMRGKIPSQNNEMKLQNGVITDKRTNTSYIIENGNIKKSFPVLTGANPDVNINDRGVDYLETHPESKATPRGTYIMDPKKDIYGQPGFRLNPVAAFGEPAARAKDIAQHVTYPGDFEKRNPLYAQAAKNRYASYGCVNCRKPDINYMTDRFKKGDTTMVIDSKIKRDANFLAKKLFSRK